MANLGLQKWHPFVPDLGNNRELPAGEQLVLEVKGGLTREEVMGHLRFIQQPETKDGETEEEARARNLSEYIRLVGSHTIGGKPVTTFAEYLEAIRPVGDAYNLRELYAAVAYFNSLQAGDALFSERRSGGTAFTPPRSAAQD
jgi:hypothetical protein